MTLINAIFVVAFAYTVTSVVDFGLYKVRVNKRKRKLALQQDIQIPKVNKEKEKVL